MNSTSPIRVDALARQLVLSALRSACSAPVTGGPTRSAFSASFSKNFPALLGGILGPVSKNGVNGYEGIRKPLVLAFSFSQPP